MRAILAGGGTGGHVIPAIAIAQELKKLCNAQVIFVGTARGMENRLVPAAGFPLRLIQIGPLNKVTFKTRLQTFSDLPKSMLDCRRILSEFRPDIVIGVGGYASGPMMMAAVLSRIPTLVFEPNYVPGFANRLVARWVSGAAVHFEETGRYFRRCKVTGVPVRQAFFDIPQKPKDGPPVLLVFGGSQGAHAINEVVRHSVAALRARIPNIQVIHQTGERDFNDAEVAYSGLGHWVEMHRFIDNMPSFFARADLVLCRSGASTVAEIAAAGKPAVFVPFPRAADDHQKRNAEALDRAGAAVMLEESKLGPESFVETVSSLLADQSRLKKMAAAAKKLSHPNAARDIADMAMRLAGVSSGSRELSS
ncbi:MAG: UDP-N-acetylglucosamine--N-acetylmuramyl-(pentapeptide) pyrophosphoryl-undecaprenol [Acidobacteriaceae bacterium]|nr:UDP-N-acetylglucosamine--N-acetylmuramyl-(pentapeptide) pyrophosphoryl-undecaprenol [Acidobacteriaceae bacterium]